MAYSQTHFNSVRPMLQNSSIARRSSSLTAMGSLSPLQPNSANLLNLGQNSPVGGSHEINANGSNANSCACCGNYFSSIGSKGEKLLDCVGCQYCPNWLCLNCVVPNIQVGAHKPTVMAALKLENVEVYCGLCCKPNMAEIMNALKMANERAAAAERQIAELQNIVRDLQNRLTNHGPPTQQPDFNSPQFIHMVASAALEISE